MAYVEGEDGEDVEMTHVEEEDATDVEDAAMEDEQQLDDGVAFNYSPFTL